MSHSHEHTSLWWPEERIKSTLNASYIISRLRPENVPRLFELPDWGEGLTSGTYMEWILTKAGRVFLILDSIGIPDRIFALVDESCDDDDLPIAEHSIDLLYLSPDGEDIDLDTRFFHAQWRFLVRGIAEGEHVVYTENEGVPVEAVRTHTSSEFHGRDDTVDKVILAGSVCKVYMRTQVQVGGAPHFFSAGEVLAEIRDLKKLSHEHVISVYASYLKEDSVSVLFTGTTADRNLHSFLTDQPMSFKRLAKEHRLQILITWPHCLASAVSWLHARGHSHGAIRPSNILIDANFHIRLGQFQALDSLLTPPHVNDLEAYNYSAPERWTRTPAASAQRPQHPVQTLLPSGGRTKRKQRPARIALAPLNESPLPSPDHPRPDSATSKGTVIRIGLPGSPSRFSLAFSSSSSSGASSASSIYATNPTIHPKQHISNLWPRSAKRTIPPPSIISTSTTSSSATSNTSNTSSSTSSNPATSPSSLFPPSPHHFISTQSLTPSTSPPDSANTTQPPNSPADVFSLAAITLDILTTLHKRTLTSFSAHRAARNRSAGRGGGIADASFHLARNAVQVQSWIALLEGDAMKRCRRDRRSDRVFWVVPRMLIVVRAMLDGEGQRRPVARKVRRFFEEAFSRGEFGEGFLHCPRKDGGMEEKKDKEKKVGVGEGVRQRAVSVISLESASEFDFGFSDGASGSESIVEDDDYDNGHEGKQKKGKGAWEVEQVPPELYLPGLDMNITGIEGLTFNH